MDHSKHLNSETLEENFDVLLETSELLLNLDTQVLPHLE